VKTFLYIEITALIPLMHWASFVSIQAEELAIYGGEEMLFEKENT
jgi:hypothetical protein